MANDGRNERDGGPYPAPLKPGTRILDEEILQASSELSRPTRGLFMSGLIAGFAVGIGVFVMAAVLTLGGDTLSPLVLRLLLANAFAIGFVVVVLAHVDLFTEYTTLALLPVLVGRARIRSAVRLWGLVYLSNQLAAALFAVVAAYLGPALGVADSPAFGELARELTEHDSGTILSSGTLAGWMMGLLSWLVSAGRETISQVFFVWLITFTIALLGLHHSITGTTEVLAGLLSVPGIGWTDFARFLSLATLGNTVGGIAFAVMVRHSVVVGRRRDARAAEGDEERRGATR